MHMELAVASLTFIVSLTGLVGILYGRRELQLGKYGTKSIAGSLACASACAVVAGIEGLSLGSSMIVGLIGAFSEAFTVVLPVSTSRCVRLDDNLTMPVLCAALLHLIGIKHV